MEETRESFVKMHYSVRACVVACSREGGDS